MTDKPLTAIDILILPGQAMLDLAKGWNSRLLQSDPRGFALDENHAPHITLLQRYVHTDRLPDVFGAVDSAVAAVPLASLELTAARLAHMEVAALPGIGLAGVVIKASRAVIDLQSALIEGIGPYTGFGGTAAAYVTSEAEPDINKDTLHYVDSYVPNHSGENYVAHVTVGQGTLEDLNALESEPFEPVSFQPAGFAVYHLGNNGTAQVELHRS